MASIMENTVLTTVSKEKEAAGRSRFDGTDDGVTGNEE